MIRSLALLLPLTAAAAPVPVELFQCADPSLEVTVWAASPLLRNPTNIDIDQHGRIWVAEGVNYRQQFNREPKGDRIMVLEDTDGDGKADKSWPFVQEPFLRAPLGVAVIGNKVVVSMAPDLVVYTDKDGDAVFDPSKGDTREVLLTGFNGRNHDHSLHSVTVGPDGKWYFSAGNCGAKFTDKSGRTFRIAAKQNVSWWPKDPERPDWDPNEIAGQKSDDGRVYVGGFIARMDPDGSNVEILAHNLRNSFENYVTSYGDIFASDNDDQPACRVFAVLEGGNYGFASADGQRTWQADRRPGQSIQTATWRQEDPGVAPAGDIYGGGAPTGCVFYENGALGDKHEGTLLVCESARNSIFGYKPVARSSGTGLNHPASAGSKERSAADADAKTRPGGSGHGPPDSAHPGFEFAGQWMERCDFLTTNTTGDFAGTDFKGGNQGIKADDTKTLFRPSDIAVGPDGALYISDWHDPRTGGHATMDDAMEGTIYRVAPKGFKSVVPKVELKTVEGATSALQSPAVHVRALGREAIWKAGDSWKEQFNSIAQTMEKLGFWRARTDWIEPLAPSLIHAATAKKRMMLNSVARLSAIMRQRESAASDAAAFKADPIRRHFIREAYSVRFKAAEDFQFGELLDMLETLGVMDANTLSLFRETCEAHPKEFREQMLLRNALTPPLKWSPHWTCMAQAMHPPELIPAFQTRALSPVLPLRARLEALTAIGFNDTPEAATAMLEVAVNLRGSSAVPDGGKAPSHGGKEPSHGGQEPSHGGMESSHGGMESSHGGKEPSHVGKEPSHGGKESSHGGKEPSHGGRESSHGGKESSHVGKESPERMEDAARVRETALWWLLNRKDSTWKAHGLNAALKERGIYDPGKITLLPAPLPEPVAAAFTVADAAKLPGDAKRGEAGSAKCFLCHQIGAQGADYGPDLSTFGRTQTTEALLRSIIEPDADIAHGFAGTRVETVDGIVIEGLLLSESDPLIIRSAGGLTQMVPTAKVKSKTGLSSRSLMMSATQLGLTAQEAADVAAYLRER